jgi:hypothetical protein
MPHARADFKTMRVCFVNLTLQKARAAACRSTCMALLQCYRQRRTVIRDVYVLMTQAVWASRQDSAWDTNKPPGKTVATV